MATNRQVREKRHYHACSDCGFIWDHDPAEVQGKGKEAFDKAHTCTLCGSNRNTDIACANPTEAQEFCTHGYITEGGKKFYAPEPDDRLLQAIFRGFPYV